MSLTVAGAVIFEYLVVSQSHFIMVLFSSFMALALASEGALTILPLWHKTQYSKPLQNISRKGNKFSILTPPFLNKQIYINKIKKVDLDARQLQPATHKFL